MPSPDTAVGRVYDPREPDRLRVLVDRLWPRGMPKTRARLDQWYPAVAPSTQLRTWYHHQPERFDEFTRRYLHELTQPERAAPLTHLRGVAENGPLTLLTATKAADISEAAVLAALLTTGPDGSPGTSSPRGTARRGPVGTDDPAITPGRMDGGCGSPGPRFSPNLRRRVA